MTLRMMAADELRRSARALEAAHGALRRASIAIKGTDIADALTMLAESTAELRRKIDIEEAA